jgi:hypothetical protein
MKEFLGRRLIRIVFVHAPIIPRLTVDAAGFGAARFALLPVLITGLGELRQLDNVGFWKERG